MSATKIEKKATTIYNSYNDKFKHETIKIKKDFFVNKQLYIMIIPVVLFYLIFCYAPMYGAIIAFKDFVPKLGIIKSDWIGFKHFIDLFSDPLFFRALKNTLWISVNSIFFGFPAPIIFALLLNEIRKKLFKKSVQTISYIPHFISLVVICGIIKDFSASDGLINRVLMLFGNTAGQPLLSKPNLFVLIYIISDIWKELGWSSIIYLAALSNVDEQQYEAAKIDGANRWQQTINVTIPGIMPTIVIMLILRIGGILNVGFEKIILLYNPITYNVADVISSYVYRRGLQDFDFSFATAVGLFNSIINFTFLVLANTIVRKMNETSIW